MGGMQNPAEANKASPRYKAVAPGIYEDTWNSKGTLHERPYINGKRSWRRLEVSTVSDARDILKARRTDQARAKLGLADNPYDRAILTTVGDAIRHYQKDKYPDKQMAPRPEVTRAIEEANCETLLPFWNVVQIADVKQSMFDAYFRWRAKRVKKGATGRRSTDQELSTIANVMSWAHRCEVIRYNPMPVDRITFNSESFVIPRPSC
jgi:hypothetical protein